jgi:hypothetical protein
MKQESKSGNSSDPLKEATFHALSQLIDPLLGLMFDTKVTVREFTHLLRRKAVVTANNRLLREAKHSNKSRVAILTGLPRSEVTRLLARGTALGDARRVQHPTRKILSAWFDDSSFLTKEGEPAVLPAFGRRKSFERLVEKYGGGVPVRAMLDELTRIKAIEWLKDQKIRPRHRIPTSTGLTATSISMMGERGRDLLETLLANAHATKDPLFEATAAIDNVDTAAISVGRREILQQGTNFISGIDGLFNQLKRSSGRAGARSRHGDKRIGVTVFYFEETPIKKEIASGDREVSRRKNLRRNRLD